MVRLEKKVKLSASIQPVNLPKNCKKSKAVEVVALGHGYTSNESDTSDQLNYVIMKTVPLSDCKKAFPVIGDRKTFVCAQSVNGGKGSICNGNLYLLNYNYIFDGRLPPPRPPPNRFT